MASRSSRPLSLTWLLFWVVLMVTAFAGFVALGTWQVHRLHWKHALIARVDQALHAPPRAAPGPAQWAGLSAGQDEYRRVSVDGVYLQHTFWVQASTRLGAGFWVMTPLERPDGSIVFINRGFVDQMHRAGAASIPSRRVHLVGLLRMAEPGGGFLRDNAPAEHRWYSRDVAAMGEFLHVSRVAPYFIDEAAPTASGLAPAVPGHWPVRGMTVVHFRDSHLEYALTWYALALMVAAAMAYGGYQEYRRRAVCAPDRDD